MPNFALPMTHPVVQTQLAALNPCKAIARSNSMWTTMQIQSAPLTRSLAQQTPGPRRPTAAAAGTGAPSLPTQNLVKLAQEGPAATDDQLSAAVEALVASGTGTPRPGPATLRQGSGLWRVVHAPHINRISSLLGTKFSISYTLTMPPENGGTSEASTSGVPGVPQFYSNVRYQSPLFGAGWLSASGDLFVSGESAVELRFNRFWVDHGGDLRPFLTDANTDGGDRVITAIGRASFFEGLAVFPVLHLDPDAGVAVFRFPPLRSNIAVVRE